MQPWKLRRSSSSGCGPWLAEPSAVKRNGTWRKRLNLRKQNKTEQIKKTKTSGIKREEMPLSVWAVLFFVYVWSLSVHADTHSARNALWRDGKEHFTLKGHFILKPFFKIVENLSEDTQEARGQIYSLLPTSAIHQCDCITGNIWLWGGDNMTFDQCVRPCITLLPPNVILNVIKESFNQRAP